MIDSDLKSVERTAFAATTDTGLRDILIATMVSMLAIGPLLSTYMGDFWSAAVFVPMLAIVFVITRLTQKYLVDPRLGEALWGGDRKTQMKKMGRVMLIVNLVAFFFGIAVWYMSSQNLAISWLVPLSLAIIVLILFSALSHAYSVPRYFFYGVMLVVAIPLGELLYQQGHASHHGFPLIFGTAASIILLSGLFRLFQIMQLPIHDAEN